MARQRLGAAAPCRFSTAL